MVQDVATRNAAATASRVALSAAAAIAEVYRLAEEMRISLEEARTAAVCTNTIAGCTAADDEDWESLCD
jgi:hypothetical protein